MLPAVRVLVAASACALALSFGNPVRAETREETARKFVAKLFELAGIQVPPADPSQPGRAEFETIFSNPPVDASGKVDPAQCFAVIRRSAEAGFAPAQTLVAFSLFGGSSEYAIQKNRELASTLAHRAAAQGDPDGQAVSVFIDLLANRDRLVQGFASKDPAVKMKVNAEFIKYKSLVLSSMNKGSVVADWVSGSLWAMSAIDGADWKGYALKLVAAERGMDDYILGDDSSKLGPKKLANAEKLAGDFFDEGALGVPKDLGKAAALWGKAADLGSADAQVTLAVHYRNGEGVGKNYDRALELLRAAAAQGDGWAENDLGVMYQMGEGVSVNYSDALAWYQKAIGQGNNLARKNKSALEAALDRIPSRSGGSPNLPSPSVPDAGDDDLMFHAAAEEFWGDN